MTRTEFVTMYNMHDSLVEAVDVTEAGKAIEILIDFAFWMQEHYREGDPETGLIKVVFKNVRSFQIPPNTEWGETSILEMGEEDRYVRFLLINDMTDDSLEILIETDEVEVRIL